jgi:phenylacetate-CoA ligase
MTPEGSPVGGLDTIFHSGLPMREAQIVQETLHRIRINVVAVPGFGVEHEQDMVRGVQMRLGKNVEVVVTRVESIPRTKAGKFRVQVSLLPDRGQVLTR